jgi:hypothetical protein
MYTGEPYYKMEGKKKVKVDILPNESPINMFNVDFDTYPNVYHVTAKYGEFLNAGDCIFVPAFYYFQYGAEASPQQKKGDTKPSAIMVNIHYKGNSDLLQAFYAAVENGVLV